MKFFCFLLLPAAITTVVVGATHHIDQPLSEAMTGAVAVLAGSSAAAVTGFKSRKPYTNSWSKSIYTDVRHKVDNKKKAARRNVS